MIPSLCPACASPVIASHPIGPRCVSGHPVAEILFSPPPPMDPAFAADAARPAEAPPGAATSPDPIRSPDPVRVRIDPLVTAPADPLDAAHDAMEAVQAMRDPIDTFLTDPRIRRGAAAIWSSLIGR